MANEKDLDKLLQFIRDREKLKVKDIKSPDYTSPLDQDVMKVKGAAADTADTVTKIRNATDHIDTKGIKKVISGDDFTKKIAALRGLKGAGKKALSILPLAGTVAGLMSGDPAMAAEEAAGDVIPGYEAIKSEDAGESSADEKMMLAERAAEQKYKKSPARIDKLKALMNSRIPASEMERETEGLPSNEIPSPGAGAAGPAQVLPEMEGQIKDELKGASEISSEGLRAERLKKLFGLKG